MTATPRILVVGGSGFIGRHVVLHALERGWLVTATSLSAASIAQAHMPQVTWCNVDVSDPKTLLAAVGGVSFDYVVNCGGYINHTLYFQGGQQIFDTHFGAACHLPGLLDRTVLRAFVNLGSSDEYGNQPAPQSENCREQPISPYACGKSAATQFLEMLARTEGFPAVTLRLFLTYGPGQGDRRFLPQIIRSCIDGVAFPVSHGEQLRDFCYVADVVRAIFLALENPVVTGHVINIGSGKPLTIKSVIEYVRSVVGKGEPRYGEVPYRAGENMALYPDISKAKALLGWEPQVSIEDGIRETMQYLARQS
jgi:nucleoside-diphosphate-sugar epimerase